MSALAHDLRRRVAKNIRPIGDVGEYAYSSPQATLLPETINEKEMSAEFVIVSNIEDREYDIVQPDACVEYLDEYRANPIVLLEHDCLKPVGLSTDKSGTFHFRILPDRIIAKCFFHCLPLNGEHLSEEVFRLVTKGIFRGASPGFLPIAGRKRGYSKDAGYEYTKIRLTEWSITSQPVQAAALRMSLSGIRCKSLRKSLELQLTKSATVVGGFEGKSMSKPKTASVEFDQSVFATESACVAWLNAHGMDSSKCVPLPTSFIFTQRSGKPDAGKKSLGKGVTALLTKAFGKDDEEEDKKLPDKEEKADMDDDKIEKSDDEEKPDDDLEDGDAEDSETDDEGEEAQDDETPEDEIAPEEDADADPEQLKAEAQDLADVVGHFKALLAALPAMSERGGKMAEQYAKIAADAEALVSDLSAAFGTHYSDVALDAMATKPEEPAPEMDYSDDADVMKALKSLNATAAKIYQVA